MLTDFFKDRKSAIIIDLIKVVILNSLLCEYLLCSISLSSFSDHSNNCKSYTLSYYHEKCDYGIYL